MEISEADFVWNRAASLPERAGLLKGDRALTAVLLVHGIIMNGGVLHAVEALQPNELNDAIIGYRLFGFYEVEGLLIRARDIIQTQVDVEEYEAVFDSAYWDAIPSDSQLASAFEEYYASNADEFAPVDQRP